MRKFKITRKQLDEIINSDLMFSSDTTTPYAGSEVSITEPVGDANFGNISTTDDKAKTMTPSPMNRMTVGASGYVGSVVY